MFHRHFSTIREFQTALDCIIARGIAWIDADPVLLTITWEV